MKRLAAPKLPVVTVKNGSQSDREGVLSLEVLA
jgi:hypothetical protein